MLGARYSESLATAESANDFVTISCVCSTRHVHSGDEVCGCCFVTICTSVFCDFAADVDVIIDQEDIHDSVEDAKMAIALYRHYQRTAAYGREHLMSTLQALYAYGTVNNWTIGTDMVPMVSPVPPRNL